MNKKDLSKKMGWNLSPLYKHDSDPEMLKDRKVVLQKTEQFIKRWKNNNNYLLNSEELKNALDDYNNWQENFGALHKEVYYWHLRFSQNQVDPKVKAGLSKAENLSKKIENDMHFFEISLSKIDPKKQVELLNNKTLTKYKHFLERIFLFAPHMLSESEEKIMNLKSTSSYENWVKMVSGFLSKAESQVLDENGKKVVKSFSELLGLMNSQKKIVRDSAANEFNKVLLANLNIAESEINSILQDKKVNDEIRGFDKPYSSRLMGDDIEEEVVTNLIKTVSDKFVIANNFYKLKAKLLKVSKLKYHERNVEFGKIDKSYTFEDGRKIINKVFSKLSLDFGKIQESFVAEGRVDVYPYVGKSGGAFCTYGLIKHPVYILLNWNGKLNDVLTFAHELGHGINDELIKKTQNALNFGTPVSTAEVASTFMEDFVLQELLMEADEELRLSLMMSKLNDDVSTIFRQIAFFKFENELHQTFRKRGYLSHQEIGSIFQKHMKNYMGNYVEQSEGSENWWVYWNHLRYFFYV